MSGLFAIIFISVLCGAVLALVLGWIFLSVLMDLPPSTILDRIDSSGER